MCAKSFNFECCGNCEYGRYGVKKDQAPWAVNCQVDGRNEAETFICLLYKNETNHMGLSNERKLQVKEAQKIVCLFYKNDTIHMGLSNERKLQVKEAQKKCDS